MQKIDSNDTLTEIVVYKDTVYLAGQVPDDDTLAMAGQAKQVFRNIDKALAKAGTDKSRLLSAQVFLKDMNDFDAFNDEWNRWVAGITPPARATVQALLFNPNWLLEIVVVAALSDA